jgi:fructose-1,6-bisphosphatase/sedoheptulose 1,7-bisphosphatase-like protein
MEALIIKVLLGFISFIGGILVYQFQGIAQNIKEMSVSVQRLNEKIAVVITDQEWHMKEIEAIKNKLSDK